MSDEAGKPPSPKLLADWELWACANQLIQKHQLDAPIFAAMRADALLEAGDLDGAHNWHLIIHRIEQLLTSRSKQLH